jgi:hypothetical protein
MRKWLASYALMVVTFAGMSVPCTALEFTADRVTRTDQGIHHARIFYREGMWRLEHNETGPVSVTIVRADRAQVWHLLPATRHFKTLSYNSDDALHLTTKLENEISREIIGTQTLDGHPTTLYEVVVVARGGRRETFYQWIATDINFPLKLAKKNGDWMVEYRHVKQGRVADVFFQLPHRYRPLDDDLVNVPAVSAVLH